MRDHPRFAAYQALFDAFEAEGFELRFVGGCVRDLVMGRPDIGDIDLATSATPPETKRVLADHGFKVIPLGERFGTIATLVRGVPVEITTYRVGELYEPGSRHPVVRFGTDIRLDLGRRDLSINAMAMDRDGTIVDPYGGQRAIADGVLEVPGGGFDNTVSILRDDPLRLLRIGRFAARFAFTPTAETTRAARDTAASLEDISRERWLAEWDKLIVAARPDIGIAWLAEVGALPVVFPEAATCPPEAIAAAGACLRDARAASADALATTLRRFAWGESAPSEDDALRALRWAVWLATLSDGALAPASGRMRERGDCARRTAARLKLSNARRDRWVRLLEAPAPALGAAQPVLRREVDALRELTFLRLDMVRERGTDREALDRHEAALTALLDGEDPVPQLPRGLGARLRKAFALEGPEIGLAMDGVRELVLDGAVPNGAEADVYVDAWRAHETNRAASRGGADRDGR